MKVSESIDKDLKSAMLARDSFRVELLRGIKSAFLYAEVETGKRGTGLTEEESFMVLKKEAKKRREAVELYRQAGNTTSQDKELEELAIIENYLPKQLSEDEVRVIVDDVISELEIDTPTKADMGKIIGAVKHRVGSSADGSVVASVVNSRIG